MLLSAPLVSTLAALLVLGGLIYSASSLFNVLIARALARRVDENNENEDSLREI